MMKTGNRSDKTDIYDDYMEPLSNVKRQYQKFEAKSRKYIQMEDVPERCGGVPVLWDEESGNIYVDSQDTHTLVLGSTGSKKTRLIVMPTVRLLGWAGESMIISDPKAEIYNRTAFELEQQGYQIIVLNFRNPIKGDGWNPLSIPYRFYQEGDIDRACEMVNDIATNLLAANAKSSDPFWQDSAANMFFGLVLTLFKMCVEDKQTEMAVNISNVLKLRRQLFDNLQPSLSPIWRYIKDDEIIAPALSGIVQTASDTRAGIVSTFDQKVRYFVFQPNLMDMLSNNTLLIDQFSEEKTAIFLIMPDEKTTFHPLISLFVKQSYEYMIYKTQENISGQAKIRVNYILDEFSSLPTIKDFPAMITAARSRNIRFCLIVQSKHQLNQRYGDETETIQSNCNNWIFLTSREVPLLEEISTLCGRVREGRMPLVSVFSLQHLDKEGGQALMLCGRNRPYYAFLPDVDFYDKGDFEIRRFYEKHNNQQRIEIDGEEIANRLYIRDGLIEEEESNGQILNFEKDLKKLLDSSVFKVMEEAHKEDALLGDAAKYAYEMEHGFLAYGDGDCKEAFGHFLEALRYKPYKDKSCDCENNLGYMLRRKEIDELIIDGKHYDVPEILEKGVYEKKPFFLINMGLYSAMMGPYIDLKRGEYYMKQINKENLAGVKEWWEGLAKKGELEGYIVIYWLYKIGIILDSELGSRKEILQKLAQFGVEPEKISIIRDEK